MVETLQFLYVCNKESYLFFATEMQQWLKDSSNPPYLLVGYLK